MSSPTVQTKDHPKGTHVTYGQALLVWCRIAALSFGGPAAQIATMHRILVDEKKWISETRFLHALNYCMLLPGPEAQQLATYIGWLLHGVRGGLTAGGLFVLPGFLAILALSIIYVTYGDVPAVGAMFFGLKAAILAVVVEALLRISRRVIKNGWMVGLAGAAFVALYFFNAPFPLVILASALIGMIGGHFDPAHFHVIRPKEATGASGDRVEFHIADAQAVHRRPSMIGTLLTVLCWLAIWLGPIFVLGQFYRRDHVFIEIGVFFSKAAVVTFGGAYSVLAYIAQRAVEDFGWLKPGEMLDGLAMAETTPGPLIQVVQFVGFLGAYRQAGGNPYWAGFVGSIITTHVTYSPCFLWIFAGAPYIEALRGVKWLSSALSAITAAVVGVIVNLTVWFGLHALFAQTYNVNYGWLRFDYPDVGTVSISSLIIAVASGMALLRFKVGMMWTLLGAAIAGLLLASVR